MDVRAAILMAFVSNQRGHNEHGKCMIGVIGRKNVACMDVSVPNQRANIMAVLVKVTEVK